MFTTSRHLKHVVTIACTLALLSATGNTLAAENKFSLGLEIRSTYARWYEYPGIYYEEDFFLTGVRGEYLFQTGMSAQVPVEFGFSAALYPLGNYENSFGDENDAYGGRISAIGQAGFELGAAADLIARIELAYLAAIGSSDDGSHSETFTDYLPSIDGAIGIRLNGVKFGRVSSATLLYTFSLAELGIDTDNWVMHSPSSEDWSNSSIMLMVNF